jgi:hypothetical protein
MHTSNYISIFLKENRFKPKNLILKYLKDFSIYSESIIKYFIIF